MQSSRSWKKFKRVLVIRPDNIGDVLMTTPAIRAIKQSTSAEITLLASHSGAAISKYIPEIDSVIPFDVPWVKQPSYSGSEHLQSLIHKLRQLNFNASVIFTVYSQSPFPAALLTYLAGIPVRLAYARENPYALLTDWVPDEEPFSYVRHEVERQLELVSKVGCVTGDTRLSFRVSDAMKKDVLNIMKETGINPDHQWLVLHPGASEVKRRFSPRIYARVAYNLHKKLGYQILITGNPDEKDIIREIQKNSGSGIFDLSGVLNLGQLGALISLSPVLISSNSGPVHIAAAVGTPVVVLYALTNIQHTPWQVKNRVLYFKVPDFLKSKSSILSHTLYPNANKVSEREIYKAVKDLLPQRIIARSAELIHLNRTDSR